MVFAFAGNTSSVIKISEESHSFFTENTIHPDAFLQPESSHHLVGNSKSEHHFVVKYFVTIPESLSEIQLSNTFFPFHFQDINRCEKVSLFIFPHHFFW